jgi:hypothetical protein
MINMEVTSPLSFCVSLNSIMEGEWPFPHLSKKNNKNGGGHLPIPFRKLG